VADVERSLGFYVEVLSGVYTLIPTKSSAEPISFISTSAAAGLFADQLQLGQIS